MGRKVKIQVYSNEKGDWYCRFQVRGERVHRKCYGATNEDEAIEFAYALKRTIIQAQNGIIPREKRARDIITLKKVADNFLKYSKVNRAVYKQDVARIKVILQFFGEGKEAVSIVRKDIDNFKEYLLSIPLSKKTINLYLDILRGAYNLAKENKWLTENPFVGRHIRFKLDPLKIQYLNDKETNALCYSIENKEIKDLVIVALNSGLRKSNLLDLKWEDVDFNFMIFNITINKGKKHIKLPITDTAYEVLKNKEHVSEYVFINPNTGGKWYSSPFNRMWRKLRANVNLDKFKFHGVRHTVGTKLAREGVPLYVIKETMTHSDIQTTMQYIHAASDEIKNAMSVLNSFK